MMRIIDVHTHIGEMNAKHFDISYLKSEMKKHCVAGAVVISLETQGPAAALSMLTEVSQKNENLRCIFGVNPVTVRDADMKRLGEGMKSGAIHGIKIFPAYFPKYPNDKAYHKFYRLCIKYGLPAIIHSGAVLKEESSPRIYQKYAHPLMVDDLAVEFPELRIVIAHAGYPWLIDTSQVAYKNDNVWTDLSGLREGPVDAGDELDKHWLRWMMGYLGSEDKLMYGSDWPVVRMGEYQVWLKKMVPKRAHEKIFFKNANMFFGFGL